jgi:hypothetical protein
MNNLSGWGKIQSMITFIVSHGRGLLDEFFSILAVVICPTVYFGNFSRPVSMSGTHGGCPLQRV